jgi:hypothetical protein
MAVRGQTLLIISQAFWRVAHQESGVGIVLMSANVLPEIRLRTQLNLNTDGRILSRKDKEHIRDVGGPRVGVGFGRFIAKPAIDPSQERLTEEFIRPGWRGGVQVIGQPAGRFGNVEVVSGKGTSVRKGDGVTRSPFQMKSEGALGKIPLGGREKGRKANASQGNGQTPLDPFLQNAPSLGL